MWQSLRALFSTREIEESPFLQTLFWVLFIGFYLSFDEWINSSAILLSHLERGFHVCPTYFQNCGDLYFLEGWPESYGQAIFYSLLAGFLVLSAAAGLSKRWLEAQLLMAVPLLWKVLYLTLFTFETHMNFEYFHVPVALAFVFLPQKALLTRVVFAMVYLMAATVKLDEGWIAGTYFSSMKPGMPLVPDAWIPLFSNAVILFEIFSPYFLFSRTREVRWTAVALWTAFHLYSISVVYFHYPAYCLPLLWGLFIPDPPRADLRRWRSLVPGAALVAALLALSSAAYVTDDDRYSSRTKKLGVLMLDANRQCVVSVTPYLDGAARPEMKMESTAAAKRCDPYRYWFIIRQNCETFALDRVAWSMSVSVNGGPFYKTVDSEDACGLEFNSWGGNPWLLSPATGAPVVGYPQRNTPTKKSPESMNVVFESPQITLTPFAGWLQRNSGWISSLYWTLFWLWPLILGFNQSRRALRSGGSA
jgi:hypothetical protein